MAADDTIRQPWDDPPLDGGHGSAIGHEQEAFVAALLTEKSVEDAAKKAGVSPRTAFRWLRKDAVRLQYAGARRQIFAAFVNRLEEHAKAAADDLDQLRRNDPDPRTRVAADRVLIETYIRAAHIRERIEEL